LIIHSDEITEHVVYPGTPRRNLGYAELFEYAVQRNEGNVASNGAFCAITAPRTGRSPLDKFVVKSDATGDKVDWTRNQAMEPDTFDRLFNRFADYVHERECFVFNGYAGADTAHQLGVRVITEYAWHNMFIRQMLIRVEKQDLKQHRPEFRVICMPGLKCDPSRDGTRSDAVIAINFERRVALIGGTRYAGEIKKSVFTIMNYLLPLQGVLTMHCSANVTPANEVALFFGLSGTGKTTLSAHPGCRLIGDDEHGWGKNGVFNIEGGCYAKCIGLTEEQEPDIYRAIRFGSILENIILEDDRDPDYNDTTITENTRVAYPLNHIPNAVIPSVAGHPKKIIFLTADATGVLPPVSRLDLNQAMYHFLSGYTSKLAGTETGITEPKAVFSECFGAPFMPLPPSVYAQMLGEKIQHHNAECYLVNTGWNGGAYGTGKRISLSHTRAIVDAILSGKLATAQVNPDPVFGLGIPQSVEGVPSELLIPRNTWKDKDAFDTTAKNLAAGFRQNFARFGNMASEICNAEPKG
jgi:phosphoenolpyruvate carboxykinase (ATP)